MKLHHVAVVCSSEENADRFYGEILGLRKIKTSTLNKDLAERLFGVASEPQMILYENEDFAIEVFVTPLDPGKFTPFTHLCLAVEDRGEFLGRCQKAGLAVQQIPKGDSLLGFVQDYDGNLLEIKALPSSSR
ncbi:MAG: VOC family protein [Pseudomonadota bacterium]